jgi:hypothetical protein
MKLSQHPFVNAFDNWPVFERELRTLLEKQLDAARCSA